MDIKITGVTFDILRDALSQAHDARTFILGEMAKVIDGAADSEMSQYAPRISSIMIDTDKIGLVIGKGGETIRALEEEFEAQITIEDDGHIIAYAQTGTQADALVDRIRSMTKEVEVGDEFAGKVVKTTTFGAFVELAKGTDGLLHISNISPGQRIDTVEDVLNRATRSRCAWSRSTASAAASACASPTIPTSRASRSRSSPSVGSGDRGPRGERDGRPRGGDAAAATATAVTAAARRPRGGRSRDRDPDRS